MKSQRKRLHTILNDQKSKKNDTCYETFTRALILIFITHFMVSYIHWKYLSKVYIEDPKFQLLQPYNTVKYEVKDVYDQLIDLKNFTYTINSQPCKNYTEGLLLMIIVSSNPQNFNRRQMIRTTWGQQTHSTKLVFLTGQVNNPNLTKEIAKESFIYGDIVQGSFNDSYRNLTYKHAMGLKWIVHHCPTAKYVLKVDDDVLIDTDLLRRVLVRQLSPWGAERLILCSVIRNSTVLRSKHSKWMVTKDEYVEDYYPNYCAGWAVLYSRDVVPQLLEMTQSKPYFWIDDVQITGEAVKDLHIPHTPMGELYLTRFKAKLLEYSTDCMGPLLFGPPNLTTKQMLKLWSIIAQRKVSL